MAYEMRDAVSLLVSSPKAFAHNNNTKKEGKARRQKEKARKGTG